MSESSMDGCGDGTKGVPLFPSLRLHVLIQYYFLSPEEKEKTDTHSTLSALEDPDFPISAVFPH